jgi:hypothetical protein
MSWRHLRYGEGGSSGQGGPSGCSGSVLARAAGAARDCRCGLWRLQCTQGGRSHGLSDGGIDEWKANDEVSGARLTASWF